jgi:hypothetical protein
LLNIKGKPSSVCSEELAGPETFYVRDTHKIVSYSPNSNR